MDEVLARYKQGKFQKCLELIKLLPETNDLVENFQRENCQLVCQSLIRISENNPDKIYETQEELYLFFDRVTSMSLITNIPLQLQLTVTFNFIFWLLFYNDTEMNEYEVEEYLELVNKGLLRVLGKQISSMTSSQVSERILENLFNFKTLLCMEEEETVRLILELVIVVILYLIKLKRHRLKECAKVVSLFVGECRGIRCQASVNNFLQKQAMPINLFKFGLDRTPSVLLDLNTNVSDYLDILESMILFLMSDFKTSLKSLQRNVDSCAKSLWNYLVVLNAYELQEWDLCLGFLNRSFEAVVQKRLKVRFHIMKGKLYSRERNHKEGLMEFEKALSFSPKCPLAHYYMGQEFGRMGIYDLMTDSLEKLVKALENEDVEEDLNPNFEAILLDWIHPSDEITATDAYYSLAVSYGLNENFRKAAEAFDRVLRAPTPKKRASVVEPPDPLTLLHEAAIMHLQAGNIVRAEQITWDAIDHFQPRKPPTKGELKNLLLSKDIEWLQKVIHEELLESDLEPKQLEENHFYSEDLMFGFSQNVIGLLILSEIQRIQRVDDYKSTLSNIFSIFSQYLAGVHKKEVKEDEEHVLTLAKALAGKTCLMIAAEQMKDRNDEGVEKMFKRALSCNKGDKDALCSYYNFLLKIGRKKEALKLWRTFIVHQDTVSMDAVQSFALKYFLKDKITRREVEKIEREIQVTGGSGSV